MNHKDPFWAPQEFTDRPWSTDYVDHHMMVDNSYSPALPILVRGNEVVTLQCARHIERRLKAVHAFYLEELNKLRAERATLKDKLRELQIAQLVEGMDPNGTIWEHAAKLQTENNELLDKLKSYQK